MWALLAAPLGRTKAELGPDGGTGGSDEPDRFPEMTASGEASKTPTGGRPTGSRIQLQAGEIRLSLVTPSRGPHLTAIMQVLGGILCLAICKQWTQRTLVTNTGTAWLSLPFWLIGFGVVLFAVHAMLVHHRVELTPEKGWIQWLPFGRKRRLSMDRLLVRFDHVTRGEADGRGGVDVPVLVIEDGSNSFRLMEGFSDEERRWVRGELIAWLAKHGRR